LTELPSNEYTIDPSFVITKEDELIAIGEVADRIDSERVIVVQGYSSVAPLYEGSVLCNDKGVPIGKIYEVFGPIYAPFYTIRWDSALARQSSDASASTARGKKGGNNKRQKKVDLTAPITAANIAEVSMSSETTPSATTEGASVDAVMDTAEPEALSECGPVAETESTAHSDVADIAMDCGGDDDLTPSSAQAASILAAIKACTRGSAMYTVKRHSTFVTPESLLRQNGKGSDASNAYDEEVRQKLLYLFVYFR